MQLHRVADDPRIKTAIHHELHGKETYTTSFVFREFLNTIITDVAYVHSCAQKITEDDDGRVALASLDRLLASGRGKWSPRAARRERLVTAAILEGFPQTRVSRQRLLTRLERIGQQWMRDFFKGLLPDGSRLTITCLCQLDDAPDELERMKQGNPFPEKPSFPQRAALFLDQHKEQVQQAEQAMHQAKVKEGKDKDLLAILCRMKNKQDDYDFPNLLRPNTRNNWRLGDLLITLETPTDTAIYTTNRHFDVLCAALGRKRYQGYLPHQDPA